MKLISVFGQLMAGKDTLADELALALNQNTSTFSERGTFTNAVKDTYWERGAFANSVKDTFCSAFGVDREFIEKWKRIPEPPAGMLMPVRQALQFIGDGYRQIVPDIWIQIALRDEAKNLIISDGRYINEAKHVKNKGGITALVYRDGFLNNDPNPSESQLRPLLEYAKDYLSDGRIELNNLKNAPEGMEYFDVFVRNDTDRSSFLKKSKSILLPIIKEKYF